MSELKEIYAIDWMGPYSSLEDMCFREGSDSCFVYLITGRLPYERSKGIKYVGITKRQPEQRLDDEDHRIKQESIKDKEYWAGRQAIGIGFSA